MIPDTCLYNPTRGYYKIRMTLKQAFDISNEGIECDFADPPKWLIEQRAKKYKNINSVLRRESYNIKMPTGESQLSSTIFPDSFDIYLDHVDGITSDGSLSSFFCPYFLNLLDKIV